MYGYWPPLSVNNNKVPTMFLKCIFKVIMLARSQKLKKKNDMLINPCSPEGFSQTYFPKGGLLQPPLDYQYWRSYNPKFTTSV